MYFFIYLFIYLFIHLFIYLFIYLFICEGDGVYTLPLSLLSSDTRMFVKTQKEKKIEELYVIFHSKKKETSLVLPNFDEVM